MKKKSGTLTNSGSLWQLNGRSWSFMGEIWTTFYVHIVKQNVFRTQLQKSGNLSERKNNSEDMARQHFTKTPQVLLEISFSDAFYNTSLVEWESSMLSNFTLQKVQYSVIIRRDLEVNKGKTWRNFWQCFSKTKSKTGTMHFFNYSTPRKYLSVFTDNLNSARLVLNCMRVKEVSHESHVGDGGVNFLALHWV